MVLAKGRGRTGLVRRGPGPGSGLARGLGPRYGPVVEAAGAGSGHRPMGDSPEIWSWAHAGNAHRTGRCVHGRQGGRHRRDGVGSLHGVGTSDDYRDVGVNATAWDGTSAYHLVALAAPIGMAMYLGRPRE